MRFMRFCSWMCIILRIEIVIFFYYFLVVMVEMSVSLRVIFGIVGCDVNFLVIVMMCVFVVVKLGVLFSILSWVCNMKRLNFFVFLFCLSILMVDGNLVSVVVVL